MAEENGQETNSSSDKNGSQPSEQSSHEEQLTEISGWLMKRSKISHKWKKRWFHLKNTELLYGNSEQNTPKKIPLESAEIAETNIDHMSNAFRIKPKDSKRTFYVYADDETTQNSWMQAICFAKAAGGVGDQSQACVLQ